MTEHTNYGMKQSKYVIDETGLLSWLGIEIVSLEEGRVVLSLPHADHLLNAGTNIIHGGAIATLVDNAGAAALRTLLSNPETANYATADLNITYMRPATSDLRAEAEVRRSGSSLTVVQVEVSASHKGERKVVALGRPSYFVTSDH